MLLQDLLAEATGILTGANIEEAKEEARWLLEDIVGIPVARQLADPNIDIAQEEVDAYLEGINRRAKHEPYAYIVGKQEFYGLNFVVENCLVPRPESEQLVSIAQSFAKRNFLSGTHLPIADLCAGTGCLGISLGLKLQGSGYPVEVVATELDAGALETCKLNYRNYGFDDARVLHTDLLPPDGLTFQIILCNPPYVTEKEYQALQPEVRVFEPKQALVGGIDGLDYYRRIAEKAMDFLAPKAILLMEHGQGQREAVRELFADWLEQGFNEIVADDDRGIDRIYGLVRGVLPEE